MEYRDPKGRESASVAVSVSALWLPQCEGAFSSTPLLSVGIWKLGATWPPLPELFTSDLLFQRGEG